MNDVIQKIYENLNLGKWDIFLSIGTATIAFFLKSIISNYVIKNRSKKSQVNITVSKDKSNVEEKNIDSELLLKKIQELRAKVEGLEPRKSKKLKYKKATK